MGTRDYLDDYLDDYFDHIDRFEAFHNKRKAVKDDESSARKEARRLKEAARARKRQELDQDSSRDDWS